MPNLGRCDVERIEREGGWKRYPLEVVFPEPNPVQSRGPDLARETIKDTDGDAVIGTVNGTVA